MGGSERYVWNLAKAQSSEHEVHIYTTTRNLNAVGISDSDGIMIHRSYSPAVIWNINPITLMLRSLAKSDADLFHVHSHLYTTSNQAVAAKILKKKKSLLQIHGGVGLPPYDVGFVKLQAKGIYCKSLGSFTINNSDIIASVSKVDLDKIHEIYDVDPEHLRYIPNMVDTKLFNPCTDYPPETPTFLYLGDFERWKGVGTLIHWLKSMDKNGHDKIKMKFVGQGSFLQPLKDLQSILARKGNGVSIDVIGPVGHNKVPGLLKESTALVLPSFWEGMPTVVLEAMASGIPVISTPVGDVPQIIKHRETGFLITRSLTSFQESIESVLYSDSLISKMIVNARNLIERDFSLSRVTDIATNVYAEICT